MKLYYIIIIIIIIIFLIYIASNNTINNDEYVPLSEESCRRILYKKPDDKNLEVLNKDSNIKNLDDYILIPKKNMSMTPSLPADFTPVLNQDDTMTTILEHNEMYKENGTIKTRKIIIQKRYDNESKGEAICRRILEDIYKEKFERVRPNFLKYGNNNLEIDCFCDKLKIGLEYNGKQHYERVPHWQKTEEAFIEQIQRDTFKLDRMNECGYYLIIVPYTVDHKMLRLYIEYYLPENVYKRQLEKNKDLLEF